MSKLIEVGKTYKLVDASKCEHLQQVLGNGELTLPSDGVFTVSSINNAGNGCSVTKGVTWRGSSSTERGNTVMCIAQISLDAGAFEEVTN